MIEIRQLKLPVTHTEEDLRTAICRKLRSDSRFTYEISKYSIDSRRKDDLKYVYTVLVNVEDESRILKKFTRDVNVSAYKPVIYQIPQTGQEQLAHPPVIVGAGPAGLFCALMLAKAGYQPIVIERGADIDSRVEDVETFWQKGVLQPDSNVQFGEGGAGTFSDGKLNTLVKDKYGRNHKVLEIFAEYGAPKEILTDSKPHIGTDLLRTVIKNMRNDMIHAGGSIRFHTKLTDIRTDEAGNLTEAIVCTDQDGKQAEYAIPASVLVLAPGHSARDTFSMLYEHHMQIEPKPFAIGLRIMHKRQMINRAQYGDSEAAKQLPTASYKLTYQAPDGRGVFTFCMCPGGFVVNASSEPGMLAVNGMSNHDRMADNSNSALIVTVTPEDYESDHPLAGVAFQRRWEKAAYEAGNGMVPVQRFEDMKNQTITSAFGSIVPEIKGGYRMADLNKCLPDYIIHDIIMAIQDFDHKIAGFADGDAVLAGVETRTSSPVKIPRDMMFESSIHGVYPCGEGAGYAGGITSAAMDGLKIYEAIAGRYAPLTKK